MLRGDALAATAAGNETNPHFEQTVNTLIQHVFPQRALAAQKQAMQRDMRKPRDMTMRTFMACLVEINDKLAYFPPFNGEAQKMELAELLDIGEYASPYK